MALNLTYFNHLCLYGKMDIIHRHGEYITTIKESKNIINLHRVEDVFIEVYYHENYSNVRFIKLLLATEKRLELYAEQVKLSGLSQTIS